MTFLNPAAFWGLLLIAIPIIIHLFNFRRVKKLYFSNVAFLNAIKSQSSSKSTLKKLLVLLARILAIVALVLAFAQPVGKTESISAGKSTGYYLDNSLSMGRRADSGNDLLTEAINLTESLIEEHDDNASLAFTTTDFDEYYRPLLKKKLSEALSEVTFSTKAVSAEQIQNKILRIDPSVDELVLVSDFQKSTLGQIQEVLADTSMQFHLYRLNAENTANLYVDSVVLDNPIGLPTKNSIGVRITNTGASEVSGVLLKLLRDGSQLASFTEDFASASSTWVNIELPINGALSGKYELEIEDRDYLHDNKTYFVINDFERPVVYQIYESSVNPSIKAVYSNKEYFDLKIVDLGKISSSDMLKADLIVLDHLNSVPAWLINQLKDFDQSIIVFPGAKLDVSGVNALFASSMVLVSDTNRYEMSTSSLQHPFFQSVFSKPDEKAGMPWIKQTFLLSRPKDAVLKTALNRVVLADYGRNRFVFSSPLTDRYTNFHKHGLFLPLMYKVSMSSRNSPVLSYRLNDRLISIGNDSTMTAGEVRLHGGGMVAVPSIYSLDNKMFMEIPSVLEKPGFYMLTSKKDTLRTLAFNLPSNESKMELLSEDEWQSLAQGREHVHLYDVKDVDAFSDNITSEREGVPLWKYALLLALIFLTAELTMLRLFR